jgi:hypothetical protein
MGDLILAVEDFANSFVDQIIDIFDMSFSAVYQILRSTQDEDYVEDLKANLIEMYSCVVFAVNQKKVNYRLYDHFGHLATFIVRTCDKDLHPTVVHFLLSQEYLTNCLYLLHDSAAFYWNINNHGSNDNNIKSIIESTEIAELLTLIKKFEDRPDIKELLNFVNSRKIM